MRKIIPVLAFIFAAGIAFPQQKSIVLQNVNIVDVEKGAIVQKQNVVITGDRISSISARYQQQTGDSIVEAGGQYLIPGLWDMHTHVWTADYYFTLFIANGITGHRGLLENIFQAREWREQGKIKGPTVPAGFYAGPVVDGPKPSWPNSVAISTPEQGRRAVDSLKNKLKVDFIKVYSGLSKEAYYAIAEEAKKQGIVFAGHVPGSMKLMECIQAGQKTTEHMMGFIEESSDSSDYYYDVLRGKIKDTLLLNNRNARRSMLQRTFNEKKLNVLIDALKKNNSWVCPTMTVLRGIAYTKDSAFINDPRKVYLIGMIKNMWNPANDFRFRNATDNYFENAKKEFELYKKIVKLLHKGGVKILAGTDVPNPNCYPGFGLHDELQIFVECGLTPAQALQTATLNPAIYFDIQKDYGTVAQGKMASLILLKGNPLDDIKQTTNISAVILRGKFIDRNGLNELLARARKMSGN